MGMYINILQQPSTLECCSGSKVQKDTSVLRTKYGLVLVRHE